MNVSEINFDSSDGYIDPASKLPFLTFFEFACTRGFEIDEWVLNKFHYAILYGAYIHMDEEILRHFGDDGRKTIKDMLDEKFSESKQYGWFVYSMDDYEKFYYASCESNPQDKHRETLPDPYDILTCTDIDSDYKCIIVHPVIFNHLITMFDSDQVKKLKDNIVLFERINTKYTQYQNAYWMPTS